MTRTLLVPTLSLALAAQASTADTVDLTSAFTSGSINGAIYSTASPHAAGTGFVNSFLRVRNNGSESGYNTGVPSQQFGRDEVGGNFTRDITLGEVGQVTIDGAAYYQFLLDINESSGGNNPLLTLHDVQIYTSASAHTEYHMDLADLGVLRYSMDSGADSRVELNYDLNPQLQGPGGGSGTGDMALLVPVSFFGDAGPGSFVYLYSAFGEANASEAGFEEWWTMGPAVGLVPLPGAGAMAAAGLGLLAARRRRR